MASRKKVTSPEPEASTEIAVVEQSAAAAVATAEASVALPEKFSPPIYFDGISNEDYHAGPGVSKSQLDYVADCPALLEWSRKCPRDPDCLKAFDFGTALHCRLLEPDVFARTYVVEPKVDGRTNEGKAIKAAFALECAGKMILSADDAKQLDYSFDSVMAHPTARRFLEAAGVSERSFYAIDPETGVLLRVRPDRHAGGIATIGDVKSTDDIDKFFWSVVDYRYHVQQAMYSEVVEIVTGEPQDFFFIAVGKRREMGRYPTKVFTLPDALVQEGRELYRASLRTYAECLDSGKFPGLQVLEIPEGYARKLAAKGADNYA